MPYLTPITGGYTVGKGQLYWKPKGSSILTELGDTDGFSLSGETDKITRYTNQTPNAKKVFSAVKTETIMGKLILFQMTRLGRAMAVAAEQADLLQTADTGLTRVLTSPAVGDIIDLEALDVTITAFADDSDPVKTFVAGTHYELDAEAGLVRIIDLPDGASSNVTITYSIAEIEAGDERNDLGLFSNFDAEGVLIFRGTNEHGQQVMTRLHRAQFNPSGERNYVSEELVSQEFEIEVLADLSQTAGKEYGWERDLK